MGEVGEEAREQSESKKAREQEGAKGASSPFYSESGIPGCCQVTVGWSLDKMSTRCKEILLGRIGLQNHGGEQLPKSLQGQWSRWYSSTQNLKASDAGQRIVHIS